MPPLPQSTAPSIHRRARHRPQSTTAEERMYAPMADMRRRLGSTEEKAGSTAEAAVPFLPRRRMTADAQQRGPAARTAAARTYARRSGPSRIHCRGVRPLPSSPAVRSSISRRGRGRPYCHHGRGDLRWYGGLGVGAHGSQRRLRCHGRDECSLSTASPTSATSFGSTHSCQFGRQGDGVVVELLLESMGDRESAWCCY
ncbi:unnamed protein product [Urochloa humidicola]